MSSIGSPGMMLRKRRITAFLLVTTMLIGCLSVLPGVNAEDDAITVPEPQVESKHLTGGTLDDVTAINDMWSLDVSDGDVTILLLARNLTDTRTGNSWIDYQSDINYHAGDDLYIAQITIMQIQFLIEGKHIQSVLDSCKKIEMKHTPVQSVNGLPTMYCNITYSGVGLQQAGSVESTFDLTLSHHIIINMTQTDIKVEARFDLTNTTLVNPDTSTEYEAGTPFTIEIPYSMMLTLPNSHGEPITPSGHTDTSLEYNLTTSGGSPITVSKLKMDNNFTIFNQTGSYGSLGYSTMQYGAQSQVTHGFPGLVYKDTVSVQSDPEITIYHDSLSGSLGSILSGILMYAMMAIVLIVAAVMIVLFVVRRRARSK